MTSELKLQLMNAEDLLQLQQMSIRTYKEAFASQNTADNLQRYLEFAFNKDQLTRELAEKHSKFYFAKINNDKVGYCKVNFGPAQSDFNDDETLELERIYVLKEHQGKKIGQMILQSVIDMAANLQMKSLWLGVWEKNVRAIEFYKKNGFEFAGSHPFLMGKEMQTDLIMKIDIEKTY